MTVRANREGKRHHDPPGLSAAARVRAQGADFWTSFVALRRAVEEACPREGRWEERVLAGIAATLEFVAAHPGEARALTIKARRPRSDGRLPDDEVIAHFAKLLGEVAPAEMRHPISTDRAIVESIAAIVRGHLVDGEAERLPQSTPEIGYLVLMPYLGHSGARRWVAGISTISSGTD